MSNMELVSFPGLGLTFHLNNVAFTLFGREIYWYALIITAGLILAVAFCIAEGRRVGISSDTILDVALYGTPSAIICARIYYVIWEWERYKDHPADIFKIWEGGIAIYGAIIGAVISTVIYCRLKKVPLGKMFDLGAFGLLIGQCIGRWGNFMNAEAYGSETALPWRMWIESVGMAVHPTFLYESLWNAVGFLGLYLYRRHKKFEGELFLLYVTWYGLGRAWIEGLRTDSLYIGSIRVSQLVAVLSVIGGLATLLILRRKNASKTAAEQKETGV